VVRTNRHYGKDDQIKGHKLLDALEDDWEKAHLFAQGAAQNLVDAILNEGTHE
jgi:hypothetical protein